ncbi:MAG: TIGR03936 family radical SAM-associated protein [Treponema sp.]|jgi:radical SAM superfamily enzyme YgiQ (UPF0313 family)|nr:TIGR03936 family radical SAM-associated protein [Treponema sp.]
MAGYIDPQKTLGPFLERIEKPARYAGGEYGLLAKRDAPLKMLIAFPDLYEIGMSNQALRIIYNRLNRIPGVSCDRAFAPAPDFEALLRERRAPLYGLDTGIPLGAVDILCFTLGYELGITGVLSMLKAGSIPVLARERAGGHPVVLMGGPCVSNPLPYSRFIDAFWIGEAEAGFFALVETLRDMKIAGEGRGGLLAPIGAHPSVWMPGKKSAARAVDTQFAARDGPAAVFPVPSLRTVQHHGMVEIMRGCPNGCRFCHAGIWYRPMRQKDAARVMAEADEWVRKGGYREISLSSLSTGDYRHIGGLLDNLNRRYASRRVSFQLPSLRVSSFSLPILEKVSAVRKSGLTFAVESGIDARQPGINKTVSREQVVSILQEAKKNGWRGAKFYFMIGLPPGKGLSHSLLDEGAAITEFILDAGRRTAMHFHINVGIFIPKPHTPYQWAAQIDGAAVRETQEYIRNTLKPRGHRISLQDPCTAAIEGLISRGDDRVGELLEAAFNRGCRLDAWDEYLRRDIWEALLAEYRPLVAEVLGGKPPGEALPWSGIGSGIDQDFLREECRKSWEEEASEPCGEPCAHPCGICSGQGGIVTNQTIDTGEPVGQSGAAQTFPANESAAAVKAPGGAGHPSYRILFSFAKEGRAVWLSHLSLIEVFSMALLRADIPVLFTGGFNPLPKLDFASPLAIGISAEGEIATVDTESRFSARAFQERLNEQMPAGFSIREAVNVSIPFGHKKYAVPSLLWGYGYEKKQGADGAPGLDYVPALAEKAYRQKRIDAGASLFGMKRIMVLARRPAADGGPGESYFTVYQALYPDP